MFGHIGKDNWRRDITVIKVKAHFSQVLSLGIKISILK